VRPRRLLRQGQGLLDSAVPPGCPCVWHHRAGYTSIVQRLYTSDLAMAMAVMVAIQLVGLLAVLQFVNGLS